MIKTIAVKNGNDRIHSTGGIIHMRRAMIFAFAITVSTVFGQTKPVGILHCKCNAKANRDFLFKSMEWVDKNDMPTTSFRTGTRTEPNGLSIYDKVFAGLSTDNPTIISSALKETTFLKMGDIAEFSGSVLERNLQTVIITWKNPFGNKVWVASIDFENKKAIVTQFYNGLTSFGVNVETLDCE